LEKSLLKLSPLTEASFYVLLAFYQENHGYGVIKYVQDITNGRVILAAGTLYGVINALLKHQLIQLMSVEDSRSKKTYRITQRGKDLLQYEQLRLSEMLKAVKGVSL